MKQKGISTLKVAATYIGVIVGAGFATGQEVLQFFSRFGSLGLMGLIVTTVLFIAFGHIIMDLGKELHARSHLEIIRYAGGKIVGTVIDWIINFFLFGAFTAMIAGTGALFMEQFHLPGILGNVLMAVITAGTVLTGIQGVINSISIVVPFLFVAVIGTTVFAIIRTPPDIAAMPPVAEGSVLITNWLLSAILYVSYNSVISVAVLGPLGVEARDDKAIRNGAMLGGLGLGVTSVLIYLALAGNMGKIASLEVPMIYIAGSMSYAVQVFYAIVLIAEIYSTSVGSLFGFVARVTGNKVPARIVKWIVIGVSAAAFGASQVGFSNLVKYLYPMVGYGGIVLLACLLYVQYKKTKQAREKETTDPSGH